ncbi:hypothetical protein L6452_34801 [Arctium lappa]|uniref:Uncharacterized protein n=1 Tax=Arctium lappa TaxID=4217 RepID=A0ACB8YJS9_ARCLA|nr:hypothetical protein L6452_34801 [Arctium lappa]
MQPNDPPISSSSQHDQLSSPPPPPPVAMLQPTTQWQQSPKVLPPPLHYQSYNPMMLPNQSAPFPMGIPPQFYNLQTGSVSVSPAPYAFALSPTNSIPNHLYPDHERHWSTGLFQCTSNIKNCFTTMLCPCITFGEIAEILTEGHTPWYEPAALCACLGATSFVFIFLLWLTFPYTCLYRLKMRRKYKLKGSLLEDCTINAFCGWCALCQQYRELDHQGFNVSIGWHENKRRERQAVAVFRLIPPEEQEMTR